MVEEFLREGNRYLGHRRGLLISWYVGGRSSLDVREEISLQIPPDPLHDYFSSPLANCGRIATYAACVPYSGTGDGSRGERHLPSNRACFPTDQSLVLRLQSSRLCQREYKAGRLAIQ